MDSLGPAQGCRAKRQAPAEQDDGGPDEARGRARRRGRTRPGAGQGLVDVVDVEDHLMLVCAGATGRVATPQGWAAGCIASVGLAGTAVCAPSGAWAGLERPAPGSWHVRGRARGKERPASGSWLVRGRGQGNDSVLEDRSAAFYEFLISTVEKAIIRQTGYRQILARAFLHRLGAQEPAEMRHGERDQAPLGAVDEPLLDQPVAGR